MQKYLMLVGIIVLLSGCQSAGPGLFHYPLAPFYSSGQTIGQSVQDALMRNEDPVIAQVHVEASQKTIVLSGYVKKIRQSDMAEQIARQVPGVQTIENRIIVRQ